jgi:hypothetical protein
MRRPIDPRNHGLRKPTSIIQKIHNIYLADLDKEGEGINLESINRLWNHAYADHLSQGHRIVDGPKFKVESYYGRSNSIEYTYEWDNLNYEAELADYNEQVTQFEAAMKKYLEYEAELAEKSKLPKNLNQKIERTKQRLANLEAARDGLPLPFPE